MYTIIIIIIYIGRILHSSTVSVGLAYSTQGDVHNRSLGHVIVVGLTSTLRARMRNVNN